MKQIIITLAAFGVATGLSAAAPSHLSDYVNPMIGASTSTTIAHAEHGLGKTFPGATTPWGMTQVSPNTITGGDNGLVEQRRGDLIFGKPGAQRVKSRCCKHVPCRHLAHILVAA